MSDARWLDVADDVGSAVHHFTMAVRIFELGEMDGDDLDAYRNRMAFMQAMQSGYTSLEGGLERLLAILSEERPSGGDYHATLVRRVSRPVPGGRPAILDGVISAALDETRRFRHVARKNYNGFEVTEAVTAVEAAKTIGSGIEAAIASFKETIDPADDLTQT
ncbi:MAG: hypothetical protein H7Y08_02765 [Rhizobiaceae bacterium]|nr:hypothetical protein [Rhizobiaceae bacterium]